jgi:hypothetical protein
MTRCRCHPARRRPLLAWAVEQLQVYAVLALLGCGAGLALFGLTVLIGGRP